MNWKLGFVCIVFAGCIFMVADYLSIMMYYMMPIRKLQKVQKVSLVKENHVFGASNVRQKKKITIPNDFQDIADDMSTFVYSAYLEESLTRVRVIGITNKANLTRMHCVMRTNTSEKIVVVKGYIERIQGSHHRTYSAAYILCDLNGTVVPDTISLVPYGSTKGRKNIMSVSRITQQARQHMFTACLSPLHSQFNNTQQLTEWIELNKILGVEKIIVYVTTVTKDVLEILKYYTFKGLVTALPWRLPRKISDFSLKLLHYNGQVAAINDCLYRSKGKSIYITSIDLDELIIPQMVKHVTWSDLMSRLPKSEVYIFRCSFFTRRGKCAANNTCMDRLTIDSNVYRDNIVLSPHHRSKYIALTSNIITMGIHKPSELSTGSEYIVPWRLALLHHYRQEMISYTNVAYNKTNHKAAAKYSYKLHENLANMKIDFQNFDKQRINIIS